MVSVVVKLYLLGGDAKIGYPGPGSATLESLRVSSQFPPDKPF